VPKPLYQGQLDGLCSIYAILNASHSVAPRHFDEVKKDELFIKLINELFALHKKGETPGDILTEGVGFERLKKLIDVVKADFAEWGYGGKMIVFERAFAKNSVCEERVWESFDEHLKNGGKRAILIKLEGHWSVVSKMTENQMTLKDSDGSKIINWQNYYVKAKPYQIFFGVVTRQIARPAC